MKAIIVEDNPGAVNVLQSFLSAYPGDIEVCGIAQSLDSAKRLIMEKKPKLWLLDIRLHDQLVFSLLKDLGPTYVDEAAIIFLTAYYEPDYIHEALKVSAIDFIVKPIDREALFEVLDKAKDRVTSADLSVRIARLEERMRLMDARSANHRLPIHRVSGEIDYEDRREIIYISTEDDVTRFLLKDGRTVGTTKPLKFYEDLLNHDETFLRISKQVILNLESLKSFNPKTNMAMLTNGASIRISRRRAGRVMQVLAGERSNPH